MGCIFIPLAWDFFSIKKKMSDYYGEYLFSSPTGAFLISIKLDVYNCNDAFVFVPSRGTSNLNSKSMTVSAVNFVFVPSRGTSNLNNL